MSSARTLFDKIWDAHVVEQGDGWSLLYVDRHLMHDGGSRGLAILEERGTPVRRPDRVLAVLDHVLPTENQTAPLDDPDTREMFAVVRQAAATYGIERFFDVEDVRNGICHVVAPEQGFALPGITLVCGDSHTSTHGAVGALAFGIGASEVAHVLATQTLRQRKPQSMRVLLTGQRQPGVSAKDVILGIIGHIGTAGGTGTVMEYAGDAIRAMDMEERMTLCNMSIEAGARAGLVAPDETTFAYLKGRPSAPQQEAWDQAVRHWRTLPSDAGAVFDREAELDLTSLQPQATWGTNPGMVTALSGRVPMLDAARSASEREGWERALDYMALQPGTPLEQVPVQRVFIGSCTNSRLSDLREAARVVKGRKVADGVAAWVVPGSGLVKQAAEAEGLHRVFTEAGFDWRQPGCSLCVAMNGDLLQPGERCASTSNRNFEGRQGRGGRTHLLSPAAAAASALTGKLTDPRQFAASPL